MVWSTTDLGLQNASMFSFVYSKTNYPIKHQMFNMHYTVTSLLRKVPLKMKFNSELSKNIGCGSICNR